MSNWLLNKNTNWSDEQIDVLKSEPNLIITGSAGTGKTLLAIHLAITISEKGYNVGLIVYTKSLKAYIKEAINNNDALNKISAFYEWEWLRCKDKFDYIILDEFQDFSLTDINSIIPFSKLGVYLFGDIEQTLYDKNLNGQSVISINELDTLEGFRKKKLTTNYRISKQNILVVDNISYNLQIEKSLKINDHISSNKPHLYQFESHQQEMNWIFDFLKNNTEFKSIGLLFVHNDPSKNVLNDFKSAFDTNSEIIPSIEYFANFLLENGIENIGYKTKRIESLNFENEYNVNVLTIFSAKGLEFDCVILPFCKLSNNYFHKNLLYVALTRSKNSIIITYSGLISNEFAKMTNLLVDGKIEAYPIQF